MKSVCQFICDQYNNYSLNKLVWKQTGLFYSFITAFEKQEKFLQKKVKNNSQWVGKSLYRRLSTLTLQTLGGKLLSQLNYYFIKGIMQFFSL